MQLGGYPAGMNEGDIPNHLLNEELEGKFTNLEQTRTKMKAVFDEGRLLPNLSYTQLAYEQYC